MTSKSQMPRNAKQPVQMPQQMSPNMAEKHVDAAQRQQAMEFLQRMMMGKGGYTPVIKALKAIGVEPDVRVIDGAECLVIPMEELMAKEWRHMSELDEMKEQMG